MFDVFRERLEQGFWTSPYPAAPPKLPDRFRGLPVLDSTKCPEGCRKCVDACPTGAIDIKQGAVDAKRGAIENKQDAVDGTQDRLRLDLGKCLFCVDCIEACPAGAIEHTNEYRLAARTREDLIIGGHGMQLAAAFEAKTRSLFGRSLKLRQVSAGGCNGCESDVNVLNTLVFDLGRFGIQFVASPRHADGLLITGPVTENMRIALKKCYDCVPAPKIVIAVGACAISGGPYIDHDRQHNGADSIVPVDLYVPGCPPSPWTILDGLLRMLGKLEGTPVQ